MAPRPRFDRLDPARKEEILDAATREFAEQGPEHGSLNRILSAVGLSKGAAYYYFDDKEDLFVAVLSRMVDRVASTVGDFGPVETSDDFWREFRGLYRRGVGFLREHPLLASLAKRFVASSPATQRAPQVTARYATFRRWLTAIIERGQQVGAIRTDLPIELIVSLSFGLGEALDFWTLLNWDTIGRSEASTEALIDTGIDLFQRAFAPPHADRTRGGTR